MKKLAAVIAISIACTTTAFAQGYGPAYGPAPACAPACAPAPACGGSPCINPLAPVVGVVHGVGAFVSSTVNGFANLFGCNPC